MLSSPTVLDALEYRPVDRSITFTFMGVGLYLTFPIRLHGCIYVVVSSGSDSIGRVDVHDRIRKIFCRLQCTGSA
jgi:hypothetical protein